MAVTNRVKNVVATAVTLTSILVLYGSLHGFGPAAHTGAHAAMGQVLGQEALKLRGSGGRILVLARDTAVDRNVCSDAQWKSFKRTIKHSGASISSATFVRLNPIRLIAAPTGDFFTLIKKSSENDVIVSFIGPPVLSDEQVAQLGEQRPRIVAVCSGWTPRQVNLRRIFEQHLLSSAIISRQDSTRSTAASSEFKDSFGLVTTANLSELPLFASSASGR